MNIGSLTLENHLTSLAGVLAGQAFNSEERAELYVYGKREGDLRDQSKETFLREYPTARALAEYRLTKE